MIREYINKYKKGFKNCINDLKHRKTFYKQIPNLLTISRVIGMIPVNILFFTGNPVLAIGLIGLLLTTDFFDGKIARKYNITSEFGADLDAICDKLMFLGLVLPLLISSPVLVLNLMLEALITGINVLGRIKGLDTKTLYVGKIKTWFLSSTVFLGYLSQLVNLSNIIVIISSIVAFITQSVTFNEYLLQYDKMIKNKKSENICEDLEEVRMNENKYDVVEQLKKERELYLGVLEPGKKYSGKKRVRKMIQEKRNSH